MGVQSSSRNVWNENFLFKGQRATAWEIRVKLYFQVCRNHDPYYKGSELLHTNIVVLCKAMSRLVSILLRCVKYKECIFV